MGNFILYWAPKPSYKHANNDPTFLSIQNSKKCESDSKFKIPCRYIPCQTQTSPYLIIYFHANSEDIGENLSHFLLSIGKRFNMDILCPEYPTYGVYTKRHDDDQTLDEAILQDACTTINFCTQVLRFKCENIILMGRSLGTGVAVQLATKYNVKGVVLISPFTSIRAAATHLAGNILSKIMPNVFRSIDFIDQVQSPLLFIHGEKDALIPHQMSTQLYQKATVREKSIKINKLMTHNHMKLERDIFLPLEKFMIEVLDLKLHLMSTLSKSRLRLSLYSNNSRQSQDIVELL